MTLTSTPSSSSGFRSAKMHRNSRRKPEFHTVGQTYIDITDAKANLDYILGVITLRETTNFHSSKARPARWVGVSIAACSIYEK